LVARRETGKWFFQSGFAHYNDNVAVFRGIRVLNQVYYVLLILLALLSVWLLPRKRADAFPRATAGLSICVYFSLISLVFSGQSRFHFSLMPFIVIYAAWTVVRAAGPAAAKSSQLRPEPASSHARPTPGATYKAG
jgi:hypothetical protein